MKILFLSIVAINFYFAYFALQVLVQISTKNIQSERELTKLKMTNYFNLLFWFEAHSFCQALQVLTITQKLDELKDGNFRSEGQSQVGVDKSWDLSARSQNLLNAEPTEN